MRMGGLGRGEARCDAWMGHDHNVHNVHKRPRHSGTCSSSTMKHDTLTCGTRGRAIH